MDIERYKEKRNEIKYWHGKEELQLYSSVLFRILLTEPIIMHFPGKKIHLEITFLISRFMPVCHSRYFFCLFLLWFRRLSVIVAETNYNFKTSSYEKSYLCNCFSYSFGYSHCSKIYRRTFWKICWQRWFVTSQLTETFKTSSFCWWEYKRKLSSKSLTQIRFLPRKMTQLKSIFLWYGHQGFGSETIWRVHAGKKLWSGCKNACTNWWWFV